MRDVLARYWVMVHVALLAVFLAWVHGGTRVEYLSAIPWLSLIVLEFVLILPPTQKGETLDMARARTTRALLLDPLLYMGLALFGFLLFQYLNSGCTLILDINTNTWVFSKPPASWAPFSIDPHESRQMLYWFPPALAVALGVKHGINRRGKIYLLRALVTNGAVLSLFGMVQMLSETKNLFWMTPMTGCFFASFGYNNHAGTFFALLLMVNIGLLIHALLAPENARQNGIWLGITLLFNLLGAWLSLSCTAILISMAAVGIGGFYGIRYAWKQITIGVRLKSLAVFLTLLAFGLSCVFFFFPNNPVLHAMDTAQYRCVDINDSQAKQLTTGWRIWKDHPWFGVGGWGFRQYAVLPEYMGAEEHAHWPVGSANLHNDVVQFLVEHGAVGFGLMLGAVILLLIPISKRLWFAHISHFDGWSGEDWLLLRISPIAVAALTATTITFLQSLYDLPFRSPAILVTWTLVLACAPAFLPTAKNVTTLPRQA